MEKQIRSGIVDIIILFFNKVDQTIECINSFLPSGQQIYVLNNGSDARQVNKLKKTFQDNPQVHLLDAGKNLGVSGGRNYLIRHTSAPWIFSVDNDIRIKAPEQWMQSFENFIIKHPEALVVSPLMYNVHEKAYSAGLNVKLENNRMYIESTNRVVTNCFPGGASIIHRSVFDNYGLFDEKMFVGFEDYEYALRAILSTFGPLQVYHLDTIELIHDHQYQQCRSDKEAVRQRYSNERMQASYDRLVEKYGIVFDHDWQWWTNTQVKMMTELPLLQKLKKQIRRFLDR